MAWLRIFNENQCNCTYVKEKHDLYNYTYEGNPWDPVFGGFDTPGLFGGIFPSSFNTNSLIYDSPVVFTLTGVSLRSKKYGAGYDGNWYNNFANTICPANSPEREALIQNIGAWNCGDWIGVLISPLHMVSTAHFAGPPRQPASLSNFYLDVDGNEINVTEKCFLTKTNQLICKKLKRVLNINPITGQLTDIHSNDTVLWRVDTPTYAAFTTDEVDIYDEYFSAFTIQSFSNLKEKIATDLPDMQNQDLSNKAIGFVIDGNSRLLTTVIGIYSYPVDNNTAYGFGYRNSTDLDSSVIKHPNHTTVSVMPGDSGSPTFVYDTIRNKVIYLFSEYGNGNGHCATQSNVNKTNYILGLDGYSLIPIDINEFSPLTIQEFNDYYLQQNPIFSVIPYQAYTNTFTNFLNSPVARFPYSSRLIQPDTASQILQASTQTQVTFRATPTDIRALPEGATGPFYWPPCYSPSDLPVVDPRYSRPTLIVPCSPPPFDRCPLYASPCCFDDNGNYDGGVSSGNKECCTFIYEWQGKYWIRCNDGSWYFGGEWFPGPDPDLDGFEPGHDFGPGWIPYVPGQGVPAEYDPNGDWRGVYPSYEGFNDPCGLGDISTIRRSSSGRILYIPWLRNPIGAPIWLEGDSFDNKQIYWRRPNCAQVIVTIVDDPNDNPNDPINPL